MKSSETISVLLENACPAIRYRIRTEILGESPGGRAAKRLQAEILRDDRIQYVLGWQKPDGYLGNVFHSGMSGSLSQKDSTKGMEGAVRFLAEMGVRNDHPALRRSIQALLRDDWFRDTMGVCWQHYPDVGLSGLDLVRAATLARAGMEDSEVVVQQQYEALRTLKGIMGIRSMVDILEDFKDRKVYRPGIAFPETYHLRLLAFTHRWRHGDNVQALAEAVDKLVRLSPFPVVKVRHRSRWLGPAAIYPRDLAPDLRRMPARQWLLWFETFELFARMGVVPAVKPLARQLEQLEEILGKDGGMFRRDCPSQGAKYLDWGPYRYGVLEQNWEGERKTYDLTFRCLLILHNTGRIER
jgi:hypothetical protein